MDRGSLIDHPCYPQYNAGMAGRKSRSSFVCSSCGYRTPRWIGQCPACGEWGTFVQESESKKVETRLPPVKSVKDVTLSPQQRLITGIPELDRVLGGGLVPGAVVLVGGVPGAGKSTLLMQAADALARSGQQVLYASAEESETQIRMRAERIGSLSDNLLLYSGSVLDEVEVACLHHNVQVLVLDSVQTFRCEDVPSSPGSPLQVREVAARMVQMAKTRNISIFLIGHVTKEGHIAGPRMLEHMVDAVVYFDASGPENLRFLRAVKNRFGPVNEVGAFLMTSSGMKEVADPASAFLTGEEKETGRALACAREGTRDFVLEVHSLVRPVAFGYGRRVVTGLETGRALQTLAVVEKALGRDFRQYDVYISTVRGLRIRDTAADLAVAASVISAVRGIPLPHGSVFMGEVTLTGRVLPDFTFEERLDSLVRLGYRVVFSPPLRVKTAREIRFVPVKNVEELAEKLP